MLGKLMKYEFKSTMRTFLPMYAAIIVFAALNKAIFSIDLMSSVFSGWLSGISIFIYVALCAGVTVLSLVVGIQRFYKNLLGNEGYLMHTLPASPWQLILSKLIPATVWSTISSLIVTCASVFMALSFTELRLLPQNIASTFRLTSGLWGIDLTLVFLEILGCMVLSMAMTFCWAYASLSVGQLFNRHRVLFAFIAFMLSSFFMQFVVAFVVYANRTPLENFNTMYMSPMEIVHFVCGAIAIHATVFGALWYVVSNQLLRRRLNLL